jgi:hypothetical protein
MKTRFPSLFSVTLAIPNLGEVPIVTDLGGYTPAAGVMMFTTMTQVAEGLSTTTVTIDDTSTNTKVDAAIFAAR